MSRETIIQMAREAGFDLPTDGDDFDYPQEIERLVHLAVAKEREECAKVCEEAVAEFGGIAEGKFVTDFGKHTHQSMAAGAMNCVAAIRARGEAV